MKPPATGLWMPLEKEFENCIAIIALFVKQLSLYCEWPTIINAHDNQRICLCMLDVTLTVALLLLKLIVIQKEK